MTTSPPPADGRWASFPDSGGKTYSQCDGNGGSQGAGELQEGRDAEALVEEEAQHWHGHDDKLGLHEQELDQALLR
jgi:hypothetical protein